MEVLASSEEVQAAKKVRASAKGALTRVSNTLKKDLVLPLGEKYNFSSLDKYSIAADAEKLETNLKALNESNNKYAEVAKGVLVNSKADESVILELEETVDNYWIEARKEAASVLNLYKYEYTTALQRYLKNIDEEHKPVVTVSSVEKQKAKKKAEGEITRQVNRWSLMKVEWESLLSQTEVETQNTRPLTVEQISAQPILIDVEQRCKDLNEQWNSMKSFHETLLEVIQAGDVEPIESAKKINFDMSSNFKRLHVVRTELERLTMVVRQQDKKTEVEVPKGLGTRSSSDTDKSSVLKMDRIQTPKFTGKAEDFASWKERFTLIVPKGRYKAEVAILLEQAIPENKRHLLRNCGDDWNKMFDVLQKEVAPTRDVINAINLQLSKLKRITSEDKDSDKKFVQFVESIEKMQRDLTAINRISVLANCVTILEIEGKLPNLVKTDWFKRKHEKNLDEGTDVDKFNDMMTFLTDYKYIAKDGIAEYERAKATNAKSYTALVTGQCLAISSKIQVTNQRVKPEVENKNKSHLFCLACQDGSTDLNVVKHETANCDHWFNLSFPDRKKLVKCEFHPRTDNHVTNQCKFKKPRLPCKFCKAATHHTLFCPVHRSTANLAKSGTVFVSELPTKSIQAQVLLPFVYANVCKFDSSLPSAKPKYSRLGTLTDNCATDVWITFEAAGRLGLEGQEIKISAGGFGGKRDLIQSKLYTVTVSTKEGNIQLECLGVDKIGNDEPPPNKDKYSALCKKFRVKEKEVRRPVRVDMLIGQRANHLHPEVQIRKIDGMRLIDGPLGKTFAGVDNSGTLGGSKLASSFLISATVHQPIIVIGENQIRDKPSSIDPCVVAEKEESSLLSSSLLCKASHEFLDHFKMENIGVDCTPKCGNCSCGTCAVGGRMMSIKEEREYEVIRSNLEYDAIGTQADPGPYFRSSLPWEIDKSNLGNNRSAVLGTLNATLKRIEKDPIWRKTYDEQLQVLIDKGYARKVSKEELDSWILAGKKAYFISHQMVIVPENKTTPIRVVFNSSQKFMGVSLNSCLSLGPDTLNNLQGILIRFREHKFAAAGDISKMFYCVRVSLADQMCQLWCHKFAHSNEVETYCMTRLVMGNRPSTSISGVAMKETARLEDYFTRYPVARQALDRDSYVDNTNTGADDHETLLENIKEIEFVASKGGFFYKPWVISGLKSEDILLGPKNDDDHVEKNLGVLWIVDKDLLQVKPRVSFGGNNRKGEQISLLPVLGNIAKAIQLKLRLKDCLSAHARCFDPLGLVLPVKMTGNLLFRGSLQFLKLECGGKTIPWDAVIPEPLLERWLAYFSMLDGLKDVTFPRSVKPDHADSSILPDLVTFSDGNEPSFGAVAYVLWTLMDGSRKACIFISKAKLAPLTHKGEVVKNELSGATFAARLRMFIQQESGLEFREHIPFLDSQIVQYMFRKESYGYNTFAGLRVSEIQKKTDPHSWNHIPSQENIADLLTKGCSPSKIGTGSTWQEGPAWLTLDRSLWPVTVPNLSKEDYQVVEKFVNKSKLNNITSSLNVMSEVPPVNVNVFENLIKNSSDLDFILRVVAITRRCVRKFTQLLTCKKEKTGIYSSNDDPSQRGRRSKAVMKVNFTKVGERRFRVVSNSEVQDAWNVLVSLEQKKERNLIKEKKHLMLQNQDLRLNDGTCVTQIILGNRVQLFPVTFQGNKQVPYLPSGYLADLVARKHHSRFHVDIDSTVCHIRNQVFIPQLRKIVSYIDRNCVICKLKRRRFAEQTMGDLPDFRTDIMPPFSCVLMDLF